jgi:hypothetical protein
MVFVAFFRLIAMCRLAFDSNPLIDGQQVEATAMRRLYFMAYLLVRQGLEDSDGLLHLLACRFPSTLPVVCASKLLNS